jgi:hypothetical protein
MRTPTAVAPPADRQRPAERLAAGAKVLHLGGVLGRLVVLGGAHVVVGQRQLEPVPEREQRLLGHLLRLVGDHLALAGDPHAVALDRLRQDHRGRAGVPHRRVVRGRDLLLVEAAAVEQPDVLVRHVLDALQQLRITAEEVLAHVGAVARLVSLVLTVDRLLHHAHEPSVRVGGEERVPARPPDHLDHVPAGAAEVGFELLDDLAVAAHRPIQSLKVAVDDPDQVVELLAPGQPGRAHRLGLVHLAVAEERPHLPALGVGHPARGQVLHEPRLVDRGDRAETKRHRRELPEVRHQPRMRIAREPAGLRHLLAESVELRLGQASLQVRARVIARRRVALEEDEVATVIVRRRVPEVVETDLHHHRERLERRDVPAELG